MQNFFHNHPARAFLIPAGICAALMLAAVELIPGIPCVSTGLAHGVWLQRCPSTALRLGGEVHSSLVRGEWGGLQIRSSALWMQHEGERHWFSRDKALRGGVDVGVELLNSAGEHLETLKTRDMYWRGAQQSIQVQLPQVPDGRYIFRTTLATSFDTLVLDGDLSLFRPALVHVISDRPLYKPGQMVLLRSAVLKRLDGTPIADRQGRWVISSPDGVEMMVEESKTDEWGVSSTTFPIDDHGERGTWSARYETGSDSDQVQFEVRPFELPRFTVELTPTQPWSGLTDRVQLTGQARYTSGAPVASSEVTVQLARAQGRWPLPLAWEEPLEATTDADGSFTIELGAVPADLIELSKVQVVARVTDDTGETQVGVTSLILSEHSAHVEVVTEFQGGLVAYFNNRAYLRVTTPAGKPIRRAELLLKNPYDPTAPVMKATTDVDGVAALQVDAGEPVTIVIPPPPTRSRPFAPAEPVLSSAVVAPEGRALDLAERRSFDQVLPGIASCGVHTVGSTRVAVGLQVDSAGLTRGLVTGSRPVERCVAASLRSLRLPPGELRTYHLNWEVPDSLQPWLEPSTQDAQFSNAGGTAAIQSILAAGAKARPCLPRGVGKDAVDALEVHWIVKTGSTSVATTVKSLGGTGLSAAAASCLRRSFAAVRIDDAPKDDDLGVVLFRLRVPQAPGSVRLQASTRTGYRFEVEASVDGELVAEGPVMFTVGSIPNLRLRATPSLTAPGALVAVELFRGPSFRGKLPSRLFLEDSKGKQVVAKVDEPSRKAVFTIPQDMQGFVTVRGGGANTVLFVQPSDALSVALSTDKQIYRPGEHATLTVKTLGGDAPVSAAVSLVGVDKSLAQLAPLSTPDDWGRVTVRATGAEAFGVFGPRALQLGQIKGENAAKAAVLLVTSVPHDSPQPVAANTYSTGRPAEVEALTTSFYRGLQATIGRVRAWEASAPKGDLLTPARAAALWEAMLDAQKEAGTPVIDAYERPLTLSVLPDDLLAQVAPQQLAGDSTRLDEDVINWPRWVAENVK